VHFCLLGFSQGSLPSIVKPGFLLLRKPQRLLELKTVPISWQPNALRIITTNNNTSCFVSKIHQLSYRLVATDSTFQNRIVFPDNYLDFCGGNFWLFVQLDTPTIFIETPGRFAVVISCLPPWNFDWVSTDARMSGHYLASFFGHAKFISDL
jgi:hypothetical protein